MYVRWGEQMGMWVDLWVDGWVLDFEIIIIISITIEKDYLKNKQTINAETKKKYNKLKFTSDI